MPQKESLQAFPIKLLYQPVSFYFHWLAHCYSETISKTFTSNCHIVKTGTPFQFSSYSKSQISELTWLNP